MPSRLLRMVTPQLSMLPCRTWFPLMISIPSFWGLRPKVQPCWGSSPGLMFSKSAVRETMSAPAVPAVSSAANPIERGMSRFILFTP